MKIVMHVEKNGKDFTYNDVKLISSEEMERRYDMIGIPGVRAIIRDDDNYLYAVILQNGGYGYVTPRLTDAQQSAYVIKLNNLTNGRSTSDVSIICFHDGDYVEFIGDGLAVNVS